MTKPYLESRVSKFLSLDKFQYFVLIVLAYNSGLNVIIKSGFIWLEYLPKHNTVCTLSDDSGLRNYALSRSFARIGINTLSSKKKANHVRMDIRLGLFCVSKAQIASYISIFFIDFTIASPMLPLAGRVLPHISLASHALRLGLMLLLTPST